MPQIIEDGWESFRRAAVNPQASPEQLREMKRAFFAGAHMIVHEVIRLGEPEVPETLAMQTLADLDRETNEFKNGVLAGKN